MAAQRPTWLPQCRATAPPGEVGRLTAPGTSACASGSARGSGSAGPCPCQVSHQYNRTCDEVIPGTDMLSRGSRNMRNIIKSGTFRHGTFRHGWRPLLAGRDLNPPGPFRRFQIRRSSHSTHVISSPSSRFRLAHAWHLSWHPSPEEDLQSYVLIESIGRISELVTEALVD